MAVHIHGDGNDVHVARALAVAEQRALHAVRAGQQAQLGGGHAAAPVGVRVQAEDDAVSYTHLDVYKRQMPICAMIPIVRTPLAFLQKERF